MTKSRVGTGLILQLAIANLGIGFAWNVHTAYIPPLLKGLTSSIFLVSLVVSTASICGVVVQPLAGVWSDRVRHRLGRRMPFLLYGAPIAAASLVGLGLAPAFAAAAIAAFLFYFFTNLYTAPYMALLADLVPTEQRGTVSGVVSAVGAVAGLAAFLVGPLYDRSHAVPFLIGGAVIVLSALYTALAVREPAPPARPAPASRKQSVGSYLREFGRHREVIRFFLVESVWWLGFGALAPFFTLYASQELGIPVGLATLALAAFMVAAIIFAVIMGVLADRLGRKVTMSAALAVLFLGICGGYFARTFWQLVAVMGFAGIGWGATLTIPPAIVADILPPGREGEFFGLNNIFVSIPQTIALVVLGRLIPVFGTYRITIVVAALAMLGALLAFQTVSPVRAKATLSQASRQ
ncbi:MAG: MFS transporter [Chloroflexota bacterium]